MGLVTPQTRRPSTAAWMASKASHEDNRVWLCRQMSPCPSSSLGMAARLPITPDERVVFFLFRETLLTVLSPGLAGANQPSFSLGEENTEVGNSASPSLLIDNGTGLLRAEPRLPHRQNGYPQPGPGQTSGKGLAWASTTGDGQRFPECSLCSGVMQPCHLARPELHSNKRIPGGVPHLPERARGSRAVGYGGLWPMPPWCNIIFPMSAKPLSQYPLHKSNGRISDASSYWN
jgi:hypothetical protein